MYIMTLAASNIVYVTMSGTIGISNLGSSGQSWKLGVEACTAQNYNYYAISGVAVHLHLLVSLSRAWALFRPISYRNHHTIRVAIAFCVGAVLYVHILVLPGFILDAVYYRVPVENGCWIDASRQTVWMTFVTVVVYDLPKLFIPVCYPVLLWKTLQRRKIAASLRGTRLDAAQQLSVPSKARERADKENAAFRPFVLLTLFTVGVVVCWMPPMVAYILGNFIISWREMVQFEDVVSVLYSLQAILDLIFFCLST
ncbi:muscarinic acetylcholine receptor gar-3-like [Paramacrobiotus metropolitanus]|uniref:muscarinic acetylcholine receptor gar-3-like n=1 Tax=Paramacrobiotus metropolitanus TaxID=2943436 RepID=UPI002445C2C7|nr:muscarinic acetylcholine receptor gar-3-like [Paramacrobiotus metropolitanus]